MTETVLVTGGLGRSGRWLVDGLADDYEVVCLDTAHPGFEVAERESITFRACDLVDRGETFETVAEVDPDAVVHWAALPSPERHAGGRVFETNTLATYNTLVAAGRVDARIVWASSESAYGFAFRREDGLPDRLPITEDHACRPEDPYGASKVVGEEIAKMVVRRYDTPAVSIRPSWIQYPGEYNCRSGLAEEGLALGAGNFWSYVDVRDVVSLVASALESGVRGHEAVHAAAPDNYLDRRTVDAVRDYFGAVPDDCEVESDDSPLSTAKAERLFDWTPSHSWRDAVDQDVPAPGLVADD